MDALPLVDLVDRCARELSCSICWHDQAGACASVPALRLRPEHAYHHGPYCRFAKEHGMQPRCAANKQRSLARAARGEPFAGSCPFGVWELAWPVRHADQAIGIWYLGSLSSREPLATIAGEHYAGPPLPRADRARQRELRNVAAFLARYLRLHLAAWFEAGHRLRKQHPGEWYLDRVRELIATRYHEAIGRAEAAAACGLHPDHLNRLLRATTGHGFRELLEIHRLERARALLRTGWRSVAEVGRACGYADPNYFSTVFRRAMGCSPRQFMRPG